jgi:adenylate cyclase
VTEVTREELAVRAGVAPDWVDRLVGLGILRTGDHGSFSAGDVRRARLVRGLEEAGVALEPLAEVLERGELSLASFDLPVYERFALLTDTTFQELSEQRAIPMDVLVVLREALGFAQPAPEDLVRQDELRIVPLIELQLSKGFRSNVIEQSLRVYGESLRRIAETEAAWWRTEIQLPHLAAGLSEVEMLDLTNRWGEEMTTLVDQAMLAFYHAHQEHAWSENFIGDVERALDAAGLRDGASLPPAMCFLDVTGYTRLTEERGDEAGAALAASLSRLVQVAAERFRGKVVRWLGDGVMLYFREPRSAVLAALEMLDEIARAGLPPAHVGIDAGPIVFQAGDYFGRTVNVAARIGEYARPGELLVSQSVVDATELPDVALTAIGPVELKGISAPFHLHSARRA